MLGVVFNELLYVTDHWLITDDAADVEPCEQDSEKAAPEGKHDFVSKFIWDH